MQAKIKVGVVGAGGYTGAELVRLLFDHPHAELAVAVSRGEAGGLLSSRIPALAGRSNARFDGADASLDECNAVFFAAPSGVAMRAAPRLLEKGAVVIDLGPDFRLRDAAVFEQWYGRHETPHLLDLAVYGLTEIARPALKQAALIACPGCFATAAALALIPFADRTSGTVVVDAKSGVSGAGRRTDRADLLFAELAANFKPYAVDGHRHQPEIEQTLAAYGDAGLVFVPHLLPAVRGIYANAYIPMPKAARGGEILKSHWRGEVFIDCVDGVPELAHIVGGNRVQLACRALNEELLLVMATLDNLMKGAAGQAVQNMNVRFGFDERAGLSAPVAA